MRVIECFTDPQFISAEHQDVAKLYADKKPYCA